MENTRDSEKFWRDIEKELNNLRSFSVLISENKKETDLLKRVTVLSPMDPIILSMTTHDLMTPLAAISGNLKLLKKCLNSGVNLKKIEKYSYNIGTGVHDLLEMLDQLREVASIESGVDKITLKEIDIRGVIQKMEPLFNVLAAEKKHSVVIDYSDDALNSLIDMTKYKRVINNIFANAVKYTEGNGVIRISAAKKDEMICVSVADTGSGIPEKELEEIFKPFIQIKKREPGDGSMGLGLYISSYFCKMMGGNILVESKLGRGSKFTICTPCSSSE